DAIIFFFHGEDGIRAFDVTVVQTCALPIHATINKAQELVRRTGDLSVPLHLRNAPTKLINESNYGVEYQYSHDFPGNFVEQEFMPETLSGVKLYDSGMNVAEDKLRQSLRAKWRKKYNY